MAFRPERRLEAVAESRSRRASSLPRFDCGLRPPLTCAGTRCPVLARTGQGRQREVNFKVASINPLKVEIYVNIR